MIELNKEEIARRRLLDLSLDEKLEIQGFADENKTILRWCCYVDCGISWYNGLPIYYTKQQKEELKKRYPSWSHGMNHLHFLINSESYLIGERQ